jgi:hypothetical protein
LGDHNCPYTTLLENDFDQDQASHGRFQRLAPHVLVEKSVPNVICAQYNMSVFWHEFRSSECSMALAANFHPQILRLYMQYTTKSKKLENYRAIIAGVYLFPQ